MATKPAFRDVDLMGNNRQSRLGARVVYLGLHTEEGYSTAENLVRSGNNSGAFSYHNIIDNNTRVAMVDTDYAAWCVLDANNRSLGYCFAGSRASMSRQEWIDKFRNAIRIAAWTAVEDVKKYPYLGRVIQSRPYPKGNIPCISDHYFVTKVLGVGTHTDVGPNFPWDLFTADFNAYLSGASAVVVPPVNKINEEAAQAKAWIGKRLEPVGATDERKCPDGKGRWVRFENGYIYWHPLTGAHGIPMYLFETWAALGYETAKGLGYPTSDNMVSKNGECEYQDFERGRIIRRRGGHPGYFVTGDIRRKWYKYGSETGRYGYPISNEILTPSGDRYQDFEHDRIVWSADRAVGLKETTGRDDVE
ncbi:lysin A [Gordonia phage Puppers]|nr:lysin A [Gordonia phage Puppers]